MMKGLVGSLPMRGEWIEIMRGKKESHLCSSLPMRGEWIEIALVSPALTAAEASLPMRGEWIEIAAPGAH